MRAELKEEARQEREAAVQEVIDHFKQSRVMSLEEQRTSLNTTFEREMATMERKLSNQNTEISTLRRTVAVRKSNPLSAPFLSCCNAVVPKRWFGTGVSRVRQWCNPATSSRAGGRSVMIYADILSNAIDGSACI